MKLWDEKQQNSCLWGKNSMYLTKLPALEHALDQNTFSKTEFLLGENWVDDAFRMNKVIDF